MSDQLKDALHGLAAGPKASDAEAAGAPRQSAAPTSHPSVLALRERFGDAILHHEIMAGDEHVVFIPSERVTEILGWLKEDPTQDYDLLKDVTGVGYGGGGPPHVLYQQRSIRRRPPLPYQ